jgi:RNA polymerase sigma-70 factor (TIGR02960 family)
LASVAALQHLPPRQRAVLVLRDVLGFHAAEVAEMLETSEVSVNSALQRARAALQSRRPAHRERAPLPRSPGERELVSRFADAVARGDVDGMVSLLTDDALLTMPPLPLEYQGHEAIAGFLSYRQRARGAPLRVVPTRANTQPAFGCYTPDAEAGTAQPAGLFVLTLEGDAVSAMTWFADAALFEHFGLPRTLRS